MNYVQFLQEIAHEHQFEVTYVDIEEKSYSGRCQCLVQLSTLPVAVCQGEGMTSKDAQASAARTALEYLKIMTKKWVMDSHEIDIDDFMSEIFNLALYQIDWEVLIWYYFWVQCKGF